MQKCKTDIEKIEKKKYHKPQLATMGKMNTMTKGTKGGSKLDTDGQVDAKDEVI